ncbi:unnamed protein product, partial [Polarella glacialis]
MAEEGADNEDVDLFEHLERRKSEATEAAREQAIALLRLQRQAAAAMDKAAACDSRGWDERGSEELTQPPLSFATQPSSEELSQPPSDSAGVPVVAQRATTLQTRPSASAGFPIVAQRATTLQMRPSEPISAGAPIAAPKATTLSDE